MALAILYVHLVAAMFWVGEMLVLALIVTPVAARLGDPAKRAALYQMIGRQSRPWMLGALGLLILTGAGNLWAMGIGWAQLTSTAFYVTPFGRVLAWKLAFVALIVAVTLVHDVAMRRLGSRADAAALTPEDRLRYRTLGSWVGRLNLLLGLIVVYLGLRLVFGG
ncbi:MAG: hypothetical protein IMW98_01135 [Firmicutes bacterium]|nr:hypothetical protein [Bacillota bacterium]